MIAAVWMDLPSRPLQLILIKENLKSPCQLGSSLELSVQQDTQQTLGKQGFNWISAYIHLLKCIAVLVSEVAQYCDVIQYDWNNHQIQLGT